MESKFLHAYKIFMESIDDARFVGQTIAIVPGSFKPPHKGHWEMVMEYVKNADKVIIIISNISSKAIMNCSLSLTNLKEVGKIKAEIEKFNEPDMDEPKKVINEISSKSENITFPELKEMLTLILNIENPKLDKAKKRIEKYIQRLNVLLFSSIRRTKDGNEITPEVSKEIFQIYANSYGVNDKVEILISNARSPISDSFNFIKDNCRDCNILMGSSNKENDNKRWDNLSNNDENGNILTSMPMNVNTMISATTIRDNIDKLNRDWFPEKLSDEDFSKIKYLLSSNS